MSGESRHERRHKKLTDDSGNDEETSQRNVSTSSVTSSAVPTSSTLFLPGVRPKNPSTGTARVKVGLFALLDECTLLEVRILPISNKARSFTFERIQRPKGGRATLNKVVDGGHAGKGGKRDCGFGVFPS